MSLCDASIQLTSWILLGEGDTEGRDAESEARRAGGGGGGRGLRQVLSPVRPAGGPEEGGRQPQCVRQCRLRTTAGSAASKAPLYCCVRLGSRMRLSRTTSCLGRLRTLNCIRGRAPIVALTVRNQQCEGWWQPARWTVTSKCYLLGMAQR